MQEGIYHARELGLSTGVVQDINSKLAQAGKEIATGGSACEILDAAKGIVQQEIAAGHTTAARAGNLLDDIAYIQSLVGC